MLISARRSHENQLQVRRHFVYTANSDDGEKINLAWIDGDYIGC